MEPGHPRAWLLAWSGCIASSCGHHKCSAPLPSLGAEWAWPLGDTPPPPHPLAPDQERAPERDEDGLSEDNAPLPRRLGDPGGAEGLARARATSPRLGAMGTRAPKALLLLLLLRLLPPRGASAGSLQSPGESRRGEWTEGRTPNSACAPRTRLPSSRGARAGEGGSRTALGGWGEGPGEGQPQAPPSARRFIKRLFSSSSLSAIRVVSSAYLRLLIFLPAILIPACVSSSPVMSNSVQPHRRQPTRLPHPLHSQGKNTGVGCHFLLQCMKVKSEK